MNQCHVDLTKKIEPIDHNLGGNEAVISETGNASIDSISMEFIEDMQNAFGLDSIPVLNPMKSI